MVAILNPRWPSKCKNASIYMKFGILLSYHKSQSKVCMLIFVMAAILNPRWPPKRKNAQIKVKFCILVHFDATHHNLMSVCQFKEAIGVTFSIAYNRTILLYYLVLSFEFEN